MSIDNEKGTIDGRPAVDLIEREQQAQKDVLAALDGMTVDAAKRSCDWAISRLLHESSARMHLTLIGELRKRDLLGPKS